jgi:demethylspheroidene O-methyltransferase
MAGVAPLVPGWRDRWLARRDRWLADPSFQRFAARFPLTRFVARRRARALFDLCAGFVYSQVLFACVRLGVLDALADGPIGAPALAARVRLPTDGAQRLLDAAVAIGLAELRGRDEYGLGVHGAALLGNAGARAMVEHHSLLYADLADPIALLRGAPGTTALARYWAYARSQPQEPLEDRDIAPYTELMSRSQPLVADDVLDAYPLGRHRRMLDVGGGDGSFLIAAARRAPHLQCTLFDLAPVAARARARLAAAGLSARAEAVGGDFRADPLPAGADLITFVRVLHDHDDATVLGLLRAARAAIAPGGVVLIAEPLAGTPGAEPVGAAYFGMYLLAMGTGRPRTPTDYDRLAREAGFAGVQSRRTAQPLQTGVLVVLPRVA